MWWSHQSMQALGLMHLQQPENFGIYIKPCFAILKITPWQLTAQIQVLVFCSPTRLHCPLLSKSPDAMMPRASWVWLAGFSSGVTSPSAGVTTHSMRYPYGRKTALLKLVQVFSIKGTVQIRVTYFTSFHFTSPRGNIWTLLLKGTASHGNFWFCRFF